MNSIKEYKVKVRKLEEKLERAGQKSTIQKREIQSLRRSQTLLKKRQKELTKSRDNWKRKQKLKQVKIKGLEARISRVGKAKGHHYPIDLVALCILFRVHGGCSYGSIVKILEILNEQFQLGLLKLPCQNSIQNWVSKLGLFRMENFCTSLAGQSVSLLIDESIRLGQEKLLLILSVPFEKLSEACLRMKDVKVIYMKGSTSWTGEKIRQVIEKLQKDHGFSVQNILSDQDSKLIKASSLLGIFHLPEIGHAIATCLKRVFNNTTDYNSFKNLISGYQAKGVNQALSYLRPPHQRTKARFMNISMVIKWAKKMLERFAELNQKEKTFFKDLGEHQEMISTLSQCLLVAQEISLPFKSKGLSVKTLKQARKIIKSSKKENRYMKEFLKQVDTLLNHYETFIGQNQGKTIHISSDIIESIFGKYKNKANNYALTGLTMLNLELPVYGMAQDEVFKHILNALENIYMLDLKQWKTENSADNQLVMRTNFFKDIA